MVYTFRSGKRSKSLEERGVYNTAVRHGSLASQIQQRNQYLNDVIDDILTPSSGAPSVFSTKDSGHPFATFKASTHDPYAWIEYSNAFGPIGLYRGGLDPAKMPVPNLSDPFGSASIFGPALTRYSYFSWPNINVPAPALSQQIVSTSVKNAVGAGMIASKNPWAPKADLAVTILELLQGDIPSVVKNLRHGLQGLQSLKKTLGSDYLNVQFGWVPLITDIQRAVETLFKLHLLLYGSDERRRSGRGELGTWSRMVTGRPDGGAKPVLGSIASPLFNNAGGSPYVINTKFSGPYGVISLPTDEGVGEYVRTHRVTADFRFSARFHRGAQPNGRERGFIERANELLGLEITPNVLWQLTPWTWLLDWASNLGSVAQNLTILDWSNVLLDYAYLTFQIETESSASFSSTGLITTSDKRFSYRLPKYISQHWRTVEKIREQASPYGFSVGWTGLNAFQLSILAALGMSRGR